jgi:hypothetical protein
MFSDLKGRLQHLSAFYDNASIIAFVGGNCLEKSDPQLIEILKSHPGTMTVAIPTTPLKPICKKRTTGKTGEACPREARVYTKIPYRS